MTKNIRTHFYPKCCHEFSWYSTCCTMHTVTQHTLVEYKKTTMPPCHHQQHNQGTSNMALMNDIPLLQPSMHSHWPFQQTMFPAPSLLLNHCKIALHHSPFLKITECTSFPSPKRCLSMPTAAKSTSCEGDTSWINPPWWIPSFPLWVHEVAWWGWLSSWSPFHERAACANYQGWLLPLVQELHLCDPDANKMVVPPIHYQLHSVFGWKRVQLATSCQQTTSSGMMPSNKAILLDPLPCVTLLRQWGDSRHSGMVSPLKCVILYLLKSTRP